MEESTQVGCKAEAGTREEVEPEKPGTPNNLQNPERRKAKKKP
jgi:hypothetical protein